jgi:hypothetical protein
MNLSFKWIRFSAQEAAQVVQMFATDRHTASHNISLSPFKKKRYISFSLLSKLAYRLSVVSDGGKKLISFVLSFFEIVCEREQREREREREREQREGEKIKLYLSSAQSHTNIYSLSLSCR